MYVNLDIFLIIGRYFFFVIFGYIVDLYIIIFFFEIIFLIVVFVLIKGVRLGWLFKFIGVGIVII